MAKSNKKTGGKRPAAKAVARTALPPKGRKGAAAGKSAAGKSGPARGAAARPGAGKPGASKSGMAKPGSARPAPTTRPPGARASAPKPDARSAGTRTPGGKPTPGKGAEKAGGAPRVSMPPKSASTAKPAPSDKPDRTNSPAGRAAGAPATAAVPIKVRPGKNQAGLSSKELEMFRDLLLAKRRELVGDMYSMEREALQRTGENLSNLPVHMADMGTDNYEQEFTLGLMEKDRQLLREINAALVKIQDGSYGICEGTGKPISKARLEAQPWARFSIEHARKLESRIPFRG